MRFFRFRRRLRVIAPALIALCAAATAGAGDITETQLAGIVLTRYPFFDYVRSIGEDADVSVAIDPTRFPAALGQTCDLYIVSAKNQAEWSADPSLVDARPGGPQTVTIQGATVQENTFTVAGPGELDALPTIGLGVGYDVVLDFNRDGVLNAGDIIDGHGDEAGVYLVHDTTQMGPLAVSVIEHTGGDWLDQRTFYPTDIAAMGRLPLVAVGHGWTHAYTFYDHIGFHLASYGYIVTAFENEVGNGAGLATQTASTTTLTNTDYIIGAQSTIGGGVLNGHIDPHRIVWMGHSTGGEAVVRAHTRLRTGDFVPDNYTLDDVVLVSSIAPVSFLTPADVTPFDVNYHMFVSASDTDASGQPTTGYFQSMAIYERGFGNKQLTYLHGAGHNDFHAHDQSPFGTGPDLIGKEATNAVVRGYYLPLVELYARNNVAGKDFFARMYDGFHPIGIPSNVIIANDYKDAPAAGRFVIDDYQTQSGTGVSSSGGAVTFDVTNVEEVLMRDQDGSFAWTGAQPSNGMTRYRMTGDNPRCAVFDWPAGTARFYELEVIPSQRDFTDNAFLSFRTCQGTRHPETVALDQPLTFTAALRDGNGVTSSIAVRNQGKVTQPYKRTGFGPGAGWGNEFNTVRIRLTDFLTNGSGLDLSDIVAVRFDFGGAFGSSRGRIGLDDIHVTHVDTPDSDTFEFDFPNGLPSLLQPETETAIAVRIVAVGQSYVPGSGRLFHRFDMGPYTDSPLAPLGGDLYQATLPPADCDAVAEYYFQAEGDLSGVITEPQFAPASIFTAPVAELVKVYEETLDQDPGWQREGQWAFGPPAGGGGTGFGSPDPTSGATGVNVFGVNLGGDYATSVGGPHYLTLGPVDLTGVTGASLIYHRWLNTEAKPWVSATVDVSDDGSNWTEVWSNWQGPFPAESFLEESSWTLVELDISAVADDRPEVYIRWGHNVALTTIPMSGWNIDDIAIRGRVTSTLCKCATNVPGDMNADGFVTPSDVPPFVDCLLQGAAIQLGCFCGDLNGDEITNGTDVRYLVSALLGS